MPYDSAKQTCSAYQMQLYKAGSDENAIMSSVFSLGQSNLYYIDGDNGQQCSNFNNYNGYNKVGTGSCADYVNFICEFVDKNGRFLRLSFDLIN
jgi:hypothetical protein